MATGAGFTPSTLSDAVCCAVPVESDRVRVAKRFVGWVGEAVMPTPQVPFGGRLEQVDTKVKSGGLGPLSTGALKVSAAVPVFTMLTPEPVDVWPMKTEPKSMEAGDMEKCNPAERPTPMTPPAGLPLIFRVAERMPCAEGVK